VDILGEVTVNQKGERLVMARSNSKKRTGKNPVGVVRRNECMGERRVRREED